jgi:uncharacterized membrane protein YoaK (UPF0700 family)
LVFDDNVHTVAMPLHYLRALSGPERTDENNRRLGRALALVAGAVNAGGFFAVGQYTSHMSGIVSALADDAVTGEAALVASGLAALASFVLGAAVSALLIHWGRSRDAHSRYALPLLCEALLLLAFGWLGAHDGAFRLEWIPATVALLCFIMGLQNAIITKISRAEIRTTHVTGLVTDIGIELGGLLCRRGRPAAKLRLLTSLLAMFVLGALGGAFGFKHAGFVVTIPLAVLLLALAIVPLCDDLLAARRLGDGAGEGGK